MASCNHERMEAGLWRCASPFGKGDGVRDGHGAEGPWQRSDQAANADSPALSDSGGGAESSHVPRTRPCRQPALVLSQLDPRPRGASARVA